MTGKSCLVNEIRIGTETFRLGIGSFRIENSRVFELNLKKVVDKFLTKRKPNSNKISKSNTNSRKII